MHCRSSGNCRCRFRARYLRLVSGDPLRTAVVIEKRRTLQSNIDKLRLLQAPFMPNALQHLAQRPDVLTHNELPKDQPLIFPSDLPMNDRNVCAPGLARMEERLREGQMHDALDKLRLHLHIKTRLVTFKDRNVRNQVANTRARGRIDANEVKVKAFAAKYRRGRDAKLALAGHGEWENHYRLLADSDICTLRGDVYEPSVIPNPSGTFSALLTPETEGRRRTSWIWMSADAMQDRAQGEGDSTGMLHGKSSWSSLLYIY